MTDNQRKHSNAELRACALREINQRLHVYPGLVARGKMSQKEMGRQISMMRQIELHFAELAAVDEARIAADAALGDLFGGAG